MFDLLQLKEKVWRIILFLLCFCVNIVAQNNEHNKELVSAKKFLATKGVDTCGIELGTTLLAEIDEVVLFYNEDYFVLSATEEYSAYLDNPILAYSLEGGFYKEELTYEKIFLLYDYAFQLNELKEQNLRIFHTSEDESQNERTVSPLLGKIKWGPEYPFNAFCPTSSAFPKMRTKASRCERAMECLRESLFAYDTPSL